MDDWTPYLTDDDGLQELIASNECPQLNYRTGACKSNPRFTCEYILREWFGEGNKWEERFSVIENDPQTICHEASAFGNGFFTITEADIAALRAGKLLVYTEEYGTFIKLEKKDD